MLEPRAKKTALACNNCRRRKRKCDGRRPVCMTCEAGNMDCRYTTNLEQQRPARKNYVAALEARIVLLERMLKHAEISDSLSCATEGVSLSNDNELLLRSSEGTPPSSSLLPEASLARALVDDAASTLDYNLRPGVQLGPPKDLDLGMEQYETLIGLEHEHKLLAQFWDWQRMHLPYIAPVPFLSAYAIHSESVHPGEAIPSPPLPPPDAFAATALNVPRASSVQLTSDLAHYISPLLLYSIFAISSLFHGDPETSTAFYKKARELLFAEAQNPKLASVQAVCLMSTWELGHARSPAAWSLIGVALSLCIRLGLNINATPLLQSGAISQRLYETQNFVFWATFNTERFYAICMGMRPLIDRRIISTPKYSSRTADPIESKILIPSNTSMTWWSPSTLGMGDVLLQAAWDSIGQLIQMMDDLLDNVYATDAPSRTAQEILELVTRNHLVVQKFIDSLPTWLRSTGAIKRKDSGLVYLHLFIHLTSILINRPFLSPHHSAQTPLTRQYRTLAFRIARASALQVSSLIRHIPLSSPCVTVPYIVYSACTVLLLAPEDPATMDGVRTGLACLDGMDETGYWVDSAEDAARRIRALAERWGVELGTSRRVLGLIGNRTVGKAYEPESENLSVASTRPTTSAGSGYGPISPQLSESVLPGIPKYTVESTAGAYIPHLGRNDHVLREDEYSFRNERATLSEDINLGIDRDLQVSRNYQTSLNALLDTQSQSTLLETHQPRNDTQGAAEQPDAFSHQTPPQYGRQPPIHHPYRRTSSKRLPHVAYALSHADPRHDMRIPYSHWHSVLPPADPNNLFPPDSSACPDMGACFHYTVEHSHDPIFVDSLVDPYADVSMDWAQDTGSNFSRHGRLPSVLVGGFGEAGGLIRTGL